MPPSISRSQLFPRCLAASCLLLGLLSPAQSQTYTGIEDLVIPIAIVAAPFVFVHDLLYGSDTIAFRSTEARTDKILKALPQPIPVQGLYIGALDARHGLTGMLVHSGLPMVEIDAAGAAWLLAQAHDPVAPSALARQHPYIRLTLAPADQLDCFAFKSRDADISQLLTVRPGYCMRAAFVDDLQSDLAVRVDASRVSHRELSWELIERGTGKLRLRLPFWETQREGHPVRVGGTYRERGETLSFARLIKALQPVDPHGFPFKSAAIMTLIDYAARKDPSDTHVKVAGDFRALPSYTIPTPWRVDKESIAEGYARAHATGLPVILNNTILILPKTDSIGPACVYRQRTACDFTDTFIAGDIIMTTSVAPVWTSTTPLYKNYLPSLMGLGVTGRDLGGRLVFSIVIAPATLPAPMPGCGAGPLKCSFRPYAIETTTTELIVRGDLSYSSNASPAPSPGKYALHVPLQAIPDLRRAPGNNPAVAAAAGADARP
jgi:hypothetical protein